MQEEEEEEEERREAARLACHAAQAAPSRSVHSPGRAPEILPHARWWRRRWRWRERLVEG